MKIQKDQRITDTHLKRKAVIYIRQSTQKQVKFNNESTKLQLSLREKAISFGWRHPVVIDDDLGVSASGYADRHGFQKMLSMITMKEIGIIFCLDASRLSRNSKDWAQLFELCGYFDTLVADIDQVFNLNNPNDRLVLGIKGTMSEMELSILKVRMRQGAIEKAKRGELKFNLSPGYSYDSNGQMAFDPDARVKKAIHLLFDQFRKHTSVRQLIQWYIENKILFPIKTNPVVWDIPKYGTFRRLFKNPMYAGVYAFGRKKSFYDYRDGALVKRTTNYLPPDQWDVCIKDHHDAYISWEEYLDIQKKNCSKQTQVGNG